MVTHPNNVDVSDGYRRLHHALETYLLVITERTATLRTGLLGNEVSFS